jgi:hypothetical protein
VMAALRTARMSGRKARSLRTTFGTSAMTAETRERSVHMIVVALKKICWGIAIVVSHGRRL